MASLSSRRLHNFSLPPLSSLNPTTTSADANYGGVSDHLLTTTAVTDHPKIRLKLKFKVSNGGVVAHAEKEGGDSSVVVGSDIQPTLFQADDDSVIAKKSQPPPPPPPPTTPFQPAAVVGKKNEKKKRRFSVTLSKREIEEDMAAIEALNGSKRLFRRPKNHLSSNNVHKRQLDLLFPGLG